jgi:cellulase
MDIWEANSQATALTPHTCNSPGPFLCTGDECGKSASGVCDKSGCGINPFSTGQKTYYGPGLTVNTSKPFTVVTQFVTSDGTPTGILTEIRRLYLQDGRVIPNAPVSATVTVASQYAPREAAAAEEEEQTANADDSIDAAQLGGAITQDFCTARNASSFLRLGGMPTMGEALARGMVLVFSIWNSEGDFMNWLDSGANGHCSNTSGDPALIVAGNPDVSVTFSNIRWGDIGSTLTRVVVLPLPLLLASRRRWVVWSTRRRRVASRCLALECKAWLLVLGLEWRGCLSISCCGEQQARRVSRKNKRKAHQDRRR